MNKGLPDPWDSLAKLLPWQAMLVQQGVCWTVGQAAATAAVVALPTTTAALSLYNNEPDGGKSYIVFAVGTSQVAAPAALDTFSLVHCINMDKPGTLPTQDIARTSVKGLKARQGPYQGNAIIDLAATVTDDLWKAVGSSQNTAVASATGAALEVLHTIPVILPPGGMYSLQITATSTSVTGRSYFKWAELYLPVPSVI